MKRCFYFLLFLVILLSSSHAQSPSFSTDSAARWAKQTLSTLTLEQKIAQLLMIRVHSDWSSKDINFVCSQVSRYGVGGVCFFSGSPVKQVQLTNRLQSISQVPMLVAIDGEWGPAMRLDSCFAFPRQMAMGALPAQEDSLIFDVGKQIALQSQTLGIHINFAPCIDINSNPQNPVINSRSFGELREDVARKGKLLVLGMQSQNVSACIKHFPGHGDTHVDSHLDLPLINKSRAQLDSLELYPYPSIIAAGVDMVMVSHLNVPALSDTSFSIATLSKSIITDLLREELRFDGIVITDAMDMKGLRNYFPEPGEAEIRSLLAGTDILLLPGNLPKVIEAITQAVRSGRIPASLIDAKCLKVLALKYQKGLSSFHPIPASRLYDRLNSAEALAVTTQVEAHAHTLLRNRNRALPCPAPSTLLLCIGAPNDADALKKLATSYGIDFKQIPKNIDKSHFASVNQLVANYQHVVVAVLQTSQYLRNKYGIDDQTVAFLKQLPSQPSYTLAYMGNPYGLSRFDRLSTFDAITVGYQYNLRAFRSMLAAIMGRADFTGRLPVSVAGFPASSGLSYQTLSSTTPTSPTAERVVHPAAARIEEMLDSAIDSRVIPGCQVLVLHKGEVIYAHNFGHLTYDRSRCVDDSTMYDVASITKPLAVTLALMRLYDEHQFRLDDPISHYIPYLRNTDKERITIKELLTHTSGLPAYIPFYRAMAPEGQWDTAYLRSTRSDAFPRLVADGVYVRSDIDSLIHSQIALCKLYPKRYLYSDLNFILLKEMVELLSGMSLDDYVMQHFYQPLQLKRTCFNPLRSMGRENIAPTEDDYYFRKQVVHGYVHDQSAALLNGVGGNAGLFSTATELSTLLQMIMNGGEWHGTQYVSPQTVKLFVTTMPMHHCSRRSLGFDTPSYLEKSKILPEQASRRTYGHQGFTGTVFWCDPDKDLIYIFLSNRVYPSVEPNNLAKSRLRLLIHEEIYKYLED